MIISIEQKGCIEMKRMTLNNIKKVTAAILLKGYTADQAENMAINCFAMVSVFGGDVEKYLYKIEDINKC